MKKRLHNITVNEKDYVYHCSLGELATGIFLFPKEDKTIKVNLFFYSNKEEGSSGQRFWKMDTILAVNPEGEMVELKILLPGFIAKVIQYLNQKNPEIFERRNKETIFEDGYAILKDMGYSEINPLWVLSLY